MWWNPKTWFRPEEKQEEKPAPAPGMDATTLKSKDSELTAAIIVLNGLENLDDDSRAASIAKGGEIFRSHVDRYLDNLR